MAQSYNRENYSIADKILLNILDVNIIIEIAIIIIL